MSAIMDLWHGSAAVLTVLATLYIPRELHGLLLLKSLANFATDKKLRNRDINQVLFAAAA